MLGSLIRADYLRMGVDLVNADIYRQNDIPSGLNQHTFYTLSDGLLDLSFYFSARHMCTHIAFHSSYLRTPKSTDNIMDAW